MYTHKCDWCLNAWCIIPSTVGSWQRCKRLEDLQRRINPGFVGGSDPFLAGCMSLLSGAHWPIIHNTNCQAPAIHLVLQKLRSLTPTCCCSWSLDRLGSLQVTTASSTGRNPRLSCTGTLWLLLLFNSSLSSLVRQETGIQSCSYKTTFTVICIQFAVWSWGTTLLRERRVGGGSNRAKNTLSYRIQTLFLYFHRFVDFCSEQKIVTEKPVSMHMAESHLMHQTTDVNLAQASRDYILTCVNKQLVSAVFLLMLISGYGSYLPWVWGQMQSSSTGKTFSYQDNRQQDRNDQECYAANQLEPKTLYDTD